MRKILLSALLSLLMTLPALAGWSVKPDGAAMIENGANSSLSLRCDNNGNTNNVPGWALRVDALDLRNLGPKVRLDFRFSNQAEPLRLLADNRMGFITFDSMNQPNQSEATLLVHYMKSAARVTLTIIDSANGTAMEPLAFNLRGSSRAISQVARACR